MTEHKTVIEMIHQAERSYGSIKEADYNCPEFVKIREIVGKVKKSDYHIEKSKKAMNRPDKPEIKRDYETGYAIAEMVAKYHITRGILRKIAKSEKWNRPWMKKGVLHYSKEEI